MAGLPSINLRALMMGTMLAGPAFAITNATWGGGNGTFTTGAAHGIVVGQQVIITGVYPYGYNGTYVTTTGTTGSTIVVAIPTNPGIYVSGGTAQAGPSTITAATWAGGSATFTTSAPHGLTVGSQVIVSGVTPTSYNGGFTTLAGTTGSTIVVPMSQNPGTYASGGSVRLGGVLGDAAPDVPIPIGSLAQAAARFGFGSEIYRMFAAYYNNNFANEVWGVGLREPTGAFAATGPITITAPPTAAGTIHLYIGGEYVPVNIATTDTVNQIAAAINVLINDDDTLPVTSTVAGNVVTLHAVWKGVGGNEITVQLNYYGGRGGEATPVGLGISLPATGQLTGGVGTPSLTNAILNMGETPFEYIAMPFTDSNSLFNIDQEFGFTDSGRWGWERQLFGHVFSARRGVPAGPGDDGYADLVQWGLQYNYATISTMGFEAASPSPNYEWAASYAAKAQRALINDPARPLQALTLNGIKSAPLHQQFDFVELNSLASSGIAIQNMGSDGQPKILREQTMYQLNLYGATDDAYELVTTLATLAKLMRNQKQAITSNFPRHKLADDGTKFGPGQAIVTPGIIKGFLVAQYRQDMYDGLVENISAFKQHLMVERDPNDPNRLNVLYPPDLINQLRIFAVLNQFRLQYDRGIDSEIIGPSPAPFNAVSQITGG
jgi:phage tail sheath gpL-like